MKVKLDEDMKPAVIVKMNKDVKRDVNQLATLFAKMNGFEVPHGYDFEESPNPRAMGIWNLAAASYNFWSLKFVPRK